MPTSAPVRILIVEDDKALCDVVCEELKDQGFSVTPAHSMSQGLERLAEVEFDVAILDMTLPDGDGMQILQTIAEQELPMEAVVLTGHGHVAGAVEAMKLGAYDYLTKPTRGAHLAMVVAKAAEKAQLRRENRALRLRVQGHEVQIDQSGAGLIGPEIVETVVQAAASDLPLVIEGPAGSGREHLARTIHARSPRSPFPFVVLDCGMSEPEALEREIFGQEDETAARPGLLEVADGGTLLVKQVEQLSPMLSSKLLRATESKQLYRCGGTRALRANVRPMAATNRDLALEVRKGRFAPELHRRWNGLTLRLGPLRERRDQIVGLAAAILKQANPRLRLADDATAPLLGYSWPGNVRELKVVVQRAAMLATGDRVDATILDAALGAAPDATPRRLEPAELERELLATIQTPPSTDTDTSDPSAGGGA